MSYLTAMLLGLVQGITEFLPVSSSGHLALLHNIFQIEEADLFFDVLLHLGTLLAVFIVYHRDIHGVIRGGFGIIGIGKERGKTTRRNADRRRMAAFVVVGTLPMALAIPLHDHLSTVLNSTVMIALMLMITGTVLYLSDRLTAGTKGLREAGIGSAFFVGIFQAVAVIPGISRSGFTISAGMFCRLEKTFAVRLSFLLSVPAILGSAAVSLSGAMESGINTALIPQYLAGMATAAFSGYFCIRLIKYLAARSHFGGFAYYCWGAGLVALMLSLIA